MSILKLYVTLILYVFLSFFLLFCIRSYAMITYKSQNSRNLSAHFYLLDRKHFHIRINFCLKYLWVNFIRSLNCCCCVCTCPYTYCCISFYAMSCCSLPLFLTLLHGLACLLLLFYFFFRPQMLQLMLSLLSLSYSF